MRGRKGKRVAGRAFVTSKRTPTTIVSLARPLLVIEFEYEPYLHLFRRSYPLRIDEDMQSVDRATIRNTEGHRLLLVLRSPYGFVTRQQAAVLCLTEIHVGWRNWRYLTEEEQTCLLESTI